MNLNQASRAIILLAALLASSCATARQQTHSTVSEHEHPRIFQTNNPIK